MYIASLFIVLVGVGATVVGCGSSRMETGEGDSATATGLDSSTTQDPPGPISCEDPSLRESLGPFELVAFPGVPLQDFPEGPDMTLASGLGVGDIDGDGLLDIVLPHAGPPQLFIQREDGTFGDETAARWPEGLDGASAAQVIDIDGDGHLDVFMCVGPIPYSEILTVITNRLFLNDGAGNLRDVSDQWGLTQETFRFCFSAAFGDIDGDDDLDMALAVNEACPLNPETQSMDCDLLLEMETPRLLWEQTSAGFEDISERLPNEHTLASFVHVAVLIDIDQDHDLDLYLINDAKGDVPFSANNRMFRNQGDGQFKLDDANDLGLNIRIAGMGLGVGDLNDDAKPDLFMSGTRGLYLMMSSQGAWYDATQSSGIVVTDNPDRVEGWGIEFADLDNDGDLDAPVMFGSLFGDSGGDEMPDAFYRNEGDQTFQEVATEFGLDDAGLGRGVLAVDINGDGWLDLLKRELGGGLLYYRARCGEASFSKVDLLQGGKNPQAIGAVIELTADGVTQRRWVLGAGTSFSSNGPLTQHFGLGSSESIERVVVTWPDGEQTLYEDVAVRERLVLER